MKQCARLTDGFSLSLSVSEGERNHISYRTPLSVRMPRSRILYPKLVDLSWSRKQRWFFSIQHYLIGFYNRGREWLLRGSNWLFKSDRYSFVLKGCNTPVLRYTVFPLRFSNHWFLQVSHFYYACYTLCYLYSTSFYNRKHVVEFA